MHFVDNIDSILPPERRELHILTNLADVVHAGVRGPVDLDHIHRRPLRNLLTICAGVAGSAGRPLLAIEGFGHDPGDRRFTDPARAGKEKRMGDPLRRDRIHQRLYDVRLSDHIVKRPGPVFSRGNLVIHIERQT